MKLHWVGVFYAAFFGFVGLYSPFLGPYLNSLGYSLTDIALALGMMQFMRIFGPFFWGWLADYTERPVIWLRLGALGGLLFSIVAFLQVSSVAWLLIAFLLLNFSISGLVPVSDAYALACCDGDTGRYGRVRLFGSVGFVLAVLGFGQWAEWRGLGDYPFWAWGSLALCFLATLFFKEYAPSSPVGRKIPHFSMREVGLRCLLLPKDMQLFWWAAFFMIFAHCALYVYLSLYLQQQGYSESVIGLLWALGVVVEILFFAVQGWLYQYLSHLNWLRLSFVACVIRFALIAFFPQQLWVLLFAQSLHGLSFAAHHTATVSWLRERLPLHLHTRGQAMYTTLAYGLGGTGGLFAGRWVWDAVSPSGVFLMASAAGLAALVIVQFLGRGVMGPIAPLQSTSSAP